MTNFNEIMLQKPAGIIVLYMNFDIHNDRNDYHTYRHDNLSGKFESHTK
jgi:hypothetical protein